MAMLLELIDSSGKDYPEIAGSEETAALARVAFAISSISGESLVAMPQYPGKVH